VPTNPSTDPRIAKRLTVLSVALVLAALSAAAIVAEPVDAQLPTLRQQIHDNLIKASTLVPYSSNTVTDTWDVMSLADAAAPPPFTLLSFTGARPAARRNIVTIYGNAQFPGASGQNPNWEHQHLWPQSFGTKLDTACGYAHNDLHHLFPSEPELNQSRGNLVFDYCRGPDCTVKGAGNRMRGGDQGMWEVWGGYYRGRRGDVARAMLYMDVRYEGGSHPGTDCFEPDLVLTNDRSLIVSPPVTSTIAYMGMLSALLRWDAEDEADASELRRNDVVEQYQGNRNPFVDDGELACQLWPTDLGCATVGPPETDTATATASATATSTPTSRWSPTPDLTREAQRNWLYLPFVEKSILPTATPPATPFTPTPPREPPNTLVPPPRRTPTPWEETPLPPLTATPTLQPPWLMVPTPRGRMRAPARPGSV
jgi:endonuclease I